MITSKTFMALYIIFSIAHVCLSKIDAAVIEANRKDVSDNTKEEEV